MALSKYADQKQRAAYAYLDLDGRTINYMALEIVTGSSETATTSVMTTAITSDNYLYSSTSIESLVYRENGAESGEFWLLAGLQGVSSANSCFWLQVIS